MVIMISLLNILSPCQPMRCWKEADTHRGISNLAGFPRPGPSRTVSIPHQAIRRLQLNQIRFQGLDSITTNWCGGSPSGPSLAVVDGHGRARQPLAPVLPISWSYPTSPANRINRFHRSALELGSQPYAVE